MDRITDSAFDSWARSQGILAIYRYREDLKLMVSGSPKDWTDARCQEAALSISKVLGPLGGSVRILDNLAPHGFVYVVIAEGRLLWEADRRVRIEYEARALSQLFDYPYGGRFDSAQGLRERVMIAAVTLLQGVRGQPQALLFSDRLRAYGVQHALQVAIGALIGIACDNLRRLRIPVPKRDIDALEALAPAVGIPPELKQHLRSLLELHDRMVHRHWEVDPDVVYAVVRDRLDEFGRFLQEVNEFWH